MKPGTAHGLFIVWDIYAKSATKGDYGMPSIELF